MYLLGPSLAAALPDGLFAYPAWMFSALSHLDMCDGYRRHHEFLRRLLVIVTPHCKRSP